MQGRKKFTPQLFYQTSLDSLFPLDHCYRLLLDELNLYYLYQSTKGYYGREGHLKKYLRFNRKRPNSIAQSLTAMKGLILLSENAIFRLQTGGYKLCISIGKP